MEKIKLNLDKRAYIKKSFAGQEIKIVPYIELEDINSIVEGTMEMIIEEKNIENNDTLLSVVDKIIAFHRMNRYILDKCCNVDFDNMEYEIYTTSGIEEYILKFIVNYDIAKEMLFDFISEYNQSMLIISMFNNLPDLSDEVDDITNKINSIDDKKLEMVNKYVIRNMAEKEVRSERVLSNRSNK